MYPFENALVLKDFAEWQRLQYYEVANADFVCFREYDAVHKEEHLVIKKNRWLQDSVMDIPRAMDYANEGNIPWAAMK